MKFLAILLTVEVLLLGGCAVQEETEEGAGVEVADATLPEETKPADGQDDATVLNCQITKAEADGVDVSEILTEATKTDETLPELLAQKGYTCTRSATP